MSLIGLDIGTNACKAILFAADGAILGSGAREYRHPEPAPGWAEQDAAAVWSAALEALRMALAAAGHTTTRRDPPVALALSVQGEAVIPVDAEGLPLRPRHPGHGYPHRRRERLAGRAELGARVACSNAPACPCTRSTRCPSCSGCSQHEPVIWRAGHQFLLYEDFFLRRLGGQAVISHCLASRTQMYDLAARRVGRTISWTLRHRAGAPGAACGAGRWASCGAEAARAGWGWS